MSVNNLENAAHVFNSMSQESQNDPMTRYLLFKVAILTSDSDTAAECLQALADQPQNTDYLLACVHAAGQAQDKICALNATLKLIYSYQKSEVDDSKVAIATLLRSTIRLAYNLMQAGELDDPAGFVGTICDVYEYGTLVPYLTRCCLTGYIYLTGYVSKRSRD